ncbi:hypothetical protein E4T39_05203 [Aureobasidium subglaciale]|nr:hypothetical protein E4T39_05203 [Aureobasidium subglaciale]
MTSLRSVQLGGREVSLEDVTDLVNHIALPPNLPTSQDRQPAVTEQNLLLLAQTAINSMESVSPQVWSPISDMLVKLHSMKQMTGFDHDLLSQDLASMQPDAEEEYKGFMLHVTSHLLRMVTQVSSLPDHLSVVHAKLARRAYKFEKGFGRQLTPKIMEISQKAQEALLTPWSNLSTTTSLVSSIPLDDRESYTNMTLHSSRKLLVKALKPLPTLKPALEFIPPSQSRIPQHRPSLPLLSPTNHLDGNLVVVLANVEKWVEVNLSTWTARYLQTPHPRSSKSLAVLMKDYWKLARSSYVSNPLEMSLALLTLLELWVSLDKICTAEIDLVKKFSPQIPLSLLEPLLLPKKDQMRRLALVEEYLRSRSQGTLQQALNIFGTPTKDSFSVCYFNRTPKLRKLCQEILRADEQKREEKYEEFLRLSADFKTLKDKADREAHEVYYNGNGEQFHEQSCRKCALLAKASAMSIELHEDVLPSDEVQRKAAVFEIAIPDVFAVWRDSTWLIIQDAGRSTYKQVLSKKISTGIWMYTPLRCYGTAAMTHRIGSNNLNQNDAAITTLIQQTMWESGSPSHDSYRTPDRETEKQALVLLRNAGKASLDWCHQLKENIQQPSIDKVTREKAVELLFSAALLCFSTFDVDDKQQSRVLRSAGDLAAAVEAQTLVRDNTPVDTRKLSGLNHAIERLWNGISMGPTWTRVSNDEPSWVWNKTLPREDDSPQVVHYNLAGGDLLVDGKPQGKLPEKILTHPLFQRVFGCHDVLQVFSSDMPGMEFRISRSFEGNIVHIGVDQDNVLIKIRSGDRVLQALPVITFENDLPTYFVREYLHWMDEATFEVEFRPLSNIWQASEDCWKLSFSGPNLLAATAHLRRRTTRLVEGLSPCGKVITDILRGLDHPLNCHITVDDSQEVDARVHLPRYNLHFRVTSLGQLFSLEYNAIVDSDQALGTLIGLQSKLVLRDEAVSGCTAERKVLVPCGRPVIEKDDYHVSVTIKDEESPNRKVFMYRIDRHLQKLRGVADLQSQLLKAYLHAITSYLLPDPFTNHTGTEEALDTLGESSLYDFAPLSEGVMVLLDLITALTPQHTYFRQRNSCSQKTHWHEILSPLIQHSDFSLAALKIFQQHIEAEILQVGHRARTMTLRSGGDKFLARRNSKRHASITKSGLFGKPERPEDGDKVYTARDQYRKTEQADQVQEIASFITSWPTKIAVHTDILAVVKEWQEIYGYHASFVTRSLQELVDIELRIHWGALYELCRNAQQDSGTHTLMFTFCPIAFGVEKKHMVLLRTMLAFAFNDVFRAIDPLDTHTAYNLVHGTDMSKEMISTAISSVVPSPKKARVNASTATKMSYAKIQRLYDAECPRLLDLIWSQRSGLCIQLPANESFELIADNVTTIIDECSRVLQECRKNKEFLQHILAVAGVLKTMQTPLFRLEMPVARLGDVNARRQISLPPSLFQLLQDEVRAASVNTRSIPSSLLLEPPRATADTSKLDELLSGLPEGAEAAHPEYIQALRASHIALNRHKIDMSAQSITLPSGRVDKHHQDLLRHVQTTLSRIQQALSPSTQAQTLLLAADLWPRASRSRLLQRLSAKGVRSINAEWKAKLLNLATKIASLQRSERMLRYLKSDDRTKLWAELKYEGRDGWSSDDYPSWLLLEIENNITIRPIQAEVAIEMIKPTSGQNSVLQLNMGDGKSSVIVPMVVAALADGERLVRLIALRPLLRQTELVLAERLGGLLGHRIGHIPFSRKTEINESSINCLSKVYERCKQDLGVIIALPEEMLSMQLMTREKLTKKPDLSSKVLDFQRWLVLNCRDILDESDEILGIRSQLIYPVGSQHMLDGKNDRWLVPQAVLRRLMHHVQTLYEVQRGQLEVDFNGKSFPIIKILSQEVFEHIIDLLVEDALEGHLVGIDFSFCTGETRQSVKVFLRTRSVSSHVQDIVSNEFQDSIIWNVLLILRGLLAHGVLQFAIQQKRWLVEYGLDSSRCLMAVPYRAKGVPSANSEFGHPDVGVLLTCLSYYYTGLTFDQIRTCFKLLSQDSNAQDLYATWASGSQTLPVELTSLDSINLDNIGICEKVLFPALRYNLETIAFYLNQVVFPKEGKEFANRISASGWDIPTTSQNPKLLTTGFSGTNDNRTILPYSIKQRDLVKLLHTNASVLNLVLDDANATYIHAVTREGKRLDVASLLALLSRQTPSIDVLIDVGAQVLEATNFELARQWLELETVAKAVVFFDKRDEATVLDRSGSITPLRISPFSSKLEGCLIYLDEVHTRGIDLAIPHGARAAVTLGPRLSKDRLMQACMRLRRLGDGHSLCFVAPPEVHHSISRMQTEDQHGISSLTVLAWCISQTCKALNNARPLRVVHALEYIRQQNILREHVPASSTPADIVTNSKRTKEFWKEIQEPESQSLSNLYGSRESRIDAIKDCLDLESTDPMMRHVIEEFDIMERAAVEDTSLDIEQEREISHEVQRQRQVQRPGKVGPLIPKVSTGLRGYISSGTFHGLMGMEGKEKGFNLFSRTSAKQSAQDMKINPQLFSAFVTRDFIFSVDLEDGSALDGFLRPVTWVLSSTETKKILIISPHEANELLLEIKASENVRLHCFAARTTKPLTDSGRMNIYTVNAHPGDQVLNSHSMLELDLIAGSLYLENAEHYERLCEFLGLMSLNFRAMNTVVSKDGFINDEIRRQIGWNKFTPFHQNPLPYFKQVFELRMQGQGFGHTHMGAILNGRVLTNNEFNSVTSAEEDQTRAQVTDDEMDTSPG